MRAALPPVTETSFHTFWLYGLTVQTGTIRQRLCIPLTITAGFKTITIALIDDGYYFSQVVKNDFLFNLLK